MSFQSYLDTIEDKTGLTLSPLPRRCTTRPTGRR